MKIDLRTSHLALYINGLLFSVAALIQILRLEQLIIVYTVMAGFFWAMGETHEDKHIKSPEGGNS